MFYILHLSFLLFISSPLVAHANDGNNQATYVAQTFLQNDVGIDNIGKETTRLNSERRKKVISSTVGAFIIIIVALTPKVLLIYSTRKKEVNDKAANSPILTNSNEIKPNVYFEELRSMVIKNDHAFLNKFRESYPDFVHHIFEKHPDLNKSELTLCAMIFLDFSAKEIAEYTFIQHRSVQTNRSRLRKKMELSSQVNLEQYIRSLYV